MALFVNEQDVKSARLEAVVIRADGRRENYGLIAYHHKSRVRTWLVNTYIRLKRRLKG